MSEEDHLTEPNPALAALVKRTVAGMAHWAGSGPAGQTCGACQHWAYDGHYAGREQLKPARCKKFSRLMNGKVGGKIPDWTAACKYFVIDPMVTVKRKPV